MGEASRDGGESLGVYVPAAASLLDDLPDGGRLTLAGSVLFTDVSGFTALSERLARQGKVGAERITEIISELFDRLLGAALDANGDLLKFGGDALLLLFTGRNHRDEALHAAARMQEVVESYRGGPQRLGMSAGLASGSIALVVAGSRHREIIVAGPAVDRALVLEREAESGETKVGSMQDHERGVWAAPGGAPDPTRYVPLELRSALGALHAEHRPVVVGFGKVTGLEFVDDGVARDVHRVVDAVQEQAGLHGVTLLGTDVSPGAAKLVLSAGAPISLGGNEDRMVRMARAVVEADLPLPIRFGIATGRVFAGEIGTGPRRVYTVMGDTVNLAARLVEQAAAGEVVTTERVLDRSQARFEVQRRPRIALKGKRKPVAPLSVGPAIAHGGQSELPLIGRHDELADLLRAVADAERGRGSLTEVVAPPGAGKSRLVTELTRRVDMRMIAVASDEYGRVDAYGTARRLIRDALGISRSADPIEAGIELVDRLARAGPGLRPWAPLLGPVVDADVADTPESAAIAPEFLRDRLHWAAAELLRATLDEPVLVWLEDTHWMDPASVELIAYLMRRVSDRPWAMVLTRRPAEQGLWLQGDATGRRMELGPLDRAAAVAMLDAVTADAPVLPDVREGLLERAGGNPLFLMGLGLRHDEALPETVESLVAAEIDRLDPRNRRVLRGLSVLGLSFSVDLAEAIAEGPLGDTVDVAIQRLSDYVGLADGRVTFRHALFQETAYEGLPYRTRRLLHARAAEALVEQADVDRIHGLLSLHHERAGQWEDAWEHAVAAGEQARQIHAIREAIDFYRRAIGVSRHLRSLSDADVSRAAEALGDLCDLAGRHREAESAYRIARRRSSQRGDRARMMMKVGMMSERAGRYPIALRWLTLARRELGDAEDPVSVELDISRAGVRFRQDRYREAVEWCDGAIARARKMGLQRELAHAYYLRGHARSLLEPGTGGDDHERALGIYEEIDDIVGQANVYNNLGLEAYYRGRWTEAIEHHRQSEDRRRRAGNVTGAATSGFNRALVLFDQGRWSEAAEALEEVRRVGAAAGSPLLEGAACCYLAAIAALQGDHTRATGLFDTAQQRIQAVGADFFLNDIRLKQAEALLLAGDHEAALEAAKSGVKSTEDRAGMEASLVGFDRVAGIALLRLGEIDEAAERFTNALELARGAELPFEEALALGGLAATASARGDEAADYEATRDDILARLDVVKVPPYIETPVSAAG